MNQQKFASAIIQVMSCMYVSASAGKTSAHNKPPHGQLFQGVPKPSELSNGGLWLLRPQFSCQSFKDIWHGLENCRQLAHE